jgi:hypothetical protein
MLMGVVLGYLFVWSGSLWVNIFAHFTNNAFAVVVTWLSQRGVVNDAAQNGPFEISPVAGMVSLAVVCALMYVVYRRRKMPELPVPVSSPPLDKL